MSPGSMLPSQDGQWLSRRDEFGHKNAEWEDFYRNNEEIVPILVGQVDNLRQIMFKAKTRGQSMVVPITEGLTVKDHIISSEPGVDITVRVYTPVLKADRYPVMLYFHGGGWALGDLEGEDRTCRGLCVNTGLVIMSVDYRLAPENPYPAGLTDAWAAFKWMQADPTKHHIDMNRILVGGTSAGANMAAVMCHQAQKRGANIHAQLLRIPVTCQSDHHYIDLGLESMHSFQDTPILRRQSMVQFLEWYSPPDASDLSVSPLLARDFLDQPPAYIQVCGRDPLRDEALAYAEKLEQAGVSIRVDIYQGMPHAFWIFPELSVTGKAAKHLIDGVKWLVKEVSDPSPKE